MKKYIFTSLLFLVLSYLIYLPENAFARINAICTTDFGKADDHSLMLVNSSLPTQTQPTPTPVCYSPPVLNYPTCAPSPTSIATQPTITPASPTTIDPIFFSYAITNQLDFVDSPKNNLYITSNYVGPQSPTGTLSVPVPFQKYNADLGFYYSFIPGTIHFSDAGGTTGATNGDYHGTRTDGSPYSSQCESSADPAINQMCVSSTDIDTPGVHYQSLPDNQNSACYSYCECGYQIGDITVTTQNVASGTQTLIDYSKLRFAPTAGGELSAPQINVTYQSQNCDVGFKNCKPDTTISPQVVSIPGKVGYFCGIAHNTYYVLQSAIPQISSSISNTTQSFDSLFPVPAGNQVEIGSTKESYYGREFGHGIDIESNPSASGITNLPQGLTNSDIPTVCMNLDYKNSGPNAQNGGDQGIIKFVPVFGANDCKQIGALNSYSCWFDGYATVNTCPPGTSYNSKANWGWPCSQNNSTDPKYQAVTSPIPNSLLVNHTAAGIKYSTPPLIYPSDAIPNINLLTNTSFTNIETKAQSCDATGCDTAIGRIPTDPKLFTGSIMQYILGFSGITALILIILGGYELITSQGDETKVKAARERITSAIIGLLFIIFSATFLQILGIDILNLPGLGK